MIFWITILSCMVVANLLTLGITALAWHGHERRKLRLAKIERGNAAFEHLMNAQKTPPPPTNVTPFKKVD